MPATWRAYGVDADGDGKADPLSIPDAIYSAANYLASSGFQKDKRKAIWHYNHAEWYINDVVSKAEEFHSQATYTANNNGSTTGSSGSSVVDVGRVWIKNSVYKFGGGRNQNDIDKGLFDCSSFVHWAFKQIGINLGPLTSTSTETLKRLGTTVSPSEVQPGDLVFFDTYKKDGHVGIYVGDGKFIGCQGSTGVAIADMSKGYWAQKFNGRVKRI